MAIDLSIIIVTYNHEVEIQKCLSSLKNIIDSMRAEIFVVDNASADDTVPQARKLLPEFGQKHSWYILTNAKNEGFTRGVNQGLERCTGKYILLLNPDTEFPMPIFRELMAVLENDEKIGIVSPQFRNSDGTIQLSCRRLPRRRDVLYNALGLNLLFPASSEFNHWKMGGFDHKTQQEVEQPQGAFLLTHRKALDQVRFLDESFPMFFSDVDWCHRFISYHWKIVFVPGVHIIHYKGTSIYRNRLKMIRTSHRSFYHYFKKYTFSFKELPGTWLTGGLLYILAVIRSIFFLIQSRIHKQ